MNKNPLMRMDLLTALMHEMGHMAGIQQHGDHASLMADVLPTGIRRLPLAATAPKSTSYIPPLSGDNINLPIGDIPAGESVTITFDVTIDATIPATTTQVSNQGTVSWDGDSIVTDDPDTGAADDQTVTQVPQADLSIAKSSSPNPVETGTGQVTYTLTVTNSGPSAAQNVVVSDTLPAALTLVSTSGCTEDPSGIPTCTISTVASGDTVDITVIANVTGSTAQLSNTATVTSTTHDPDTGDLSDTELTDTALFHDDPATLQRQKEEAITLCRRRIDAAVVLFGDGMIDKEEYRRRVERNERWKQRGE